MENHLFFDDAYVMDVRYPLPYSHLTESERISLLQELEIAVLGWKIEYDDITMYVVEIPEAAVGINAHLLGTTNRMFEYDVSPRIRKIIVCKS